MEGAGVLNNISHRNKFIYYLYTLKNKSNICLKSLRSNCTRRFWRLCYVSLHSHSQPLSPLLTCITEDENPDLPFTGLFQLTVPM